MLGKLSSRRLDCLFDETLRFLTPKPVDYAQPPHVQRTFDGAKPEKSKPSSPLPARTTVLQTILPNNASVFSRL